MKDSITLILFWMLPVNLMGQSLNLDDLLQIKNMDLALTHSHLKEKGWTYESPTTNEDGFSAEFNFEGNASGEDYPATLVFNSIQAIGPHPFILTYRGESKSEYSNFLNQLEGVEAVYVDTFDMDGNPMDLYENAEYLFQMIVREEDGEFKFSFSIVEINDLQKELN